MPLTPPLSDLARRMARVPMDTVAWPWRAARGAWALYSRWPAIRAAQVEAVRLSLEADGYVDRDLTHWKANLPLQRQIPIDCDQGTSGDQAR